MSRSVRDVLPLLPQNDLVASLTKQPAGTGLAVQLGGLDFAALTEAQLLEAARAWERQERWLAARRNELFAALRAAPGPAWEGQPVASCAEEWDSLVESARDRSLAASLGLSPSAAAERVNAAAQLALDGRLAATGLALATGEIPEASARLIATRLREHDDDLASAVEAAMLPHATTLTHRKLDRLLTREIAARRSALGALDHVVARHERRVGPPRPGDRGTASLVVSGPAEDIEVLYTAITAVGEATKIAALDASRRHRTVGAGPAGPEGPESPPDALVESLDAYRFDALINLACAALADGALPTRHGRRPTIQVTSRPRSCSACLTHRPSSTATAPSPPQRPGSSLWIRRRPGSAS